MLSAIRAPIFSDYLLLIAASALWGSAFLCNEIALADFSPLAIATYRILLAALALIGLCWVRGLRLAVTPATLLWLGAIGIMNSVFPFTLIAWGQQSIDSATTGILLATSPFVTLILSHFLTHDDRFSWPKLAGLVSGFIGCLLLFSQGFGSDGGSLPGMTAVVLAAACYSLSSLMIRKLPAMNSLVLAAGALTASSLVTVPALIYWQKPGLQTYDAATLSAVLFLAIGPTAAGYALRARIVQVNGAVFMSYVGFMIPLFAILWSWLFLKEQPSIYHAGALVLILAGLALSQGGGRYTALLSEKFNRHNV